ncbi:MAG: molybdopterin-dependent oxidoreductase [Anaerolineae bacterium]|nr:molybdopterin-dependent oxidoreductase [Anaerolineae bacterium]NIN95580.1 molybdopterin-dependent oxidoreductase [Anaerolineae bacterium]NIQ79201.1 molybdopterin-dependent oxidoreductase [Anaerolineae bacterium]
MKRRGVGFASAFQGANFHFGHRDEAQVQVEATEDGRFLIYAAASDIGEGLEAMLRVLLAEGLGGISPRLIEWVQPSTANSPNPGSTGASRMTTVVGNAIWRAGQELRNVMVKVAAALIGVEEGAVRVEQDHLRAGDHVLELGDVFAEAKRRGIPLRVEAAFTASDTTPVDEYGQGEMPVNQFSYATHIAEVEVDTETGEVAVLRVVAVHDSGRIINPVSAEGQVEGGVAMGLGQTLTEELVLKDGIPLIESFSTYLIPTVYDAPESIEPQFVDGGAPFGDLGVKGLAEIPCVPIIAAITNAIYNATGARVRTLPATPERVWRAMRAVGKVSTGSQEKQDGNA